MAYDIAILGGGMAGMAAAVTAARLGHATLVLTGDVLGGQLVSIEKVEGYPGFPEGAPGYDLCPMTQEQAEAAGAEFLMARAWAMRAEGNLWRIATSEGDVTARGVVVATGSSLAQLGVPGEERLFGKGVSHCASCDAPMLRGQTAIVVGGGDSAMQEALTLAEHVEKVIMIQRGAALTGQAVYRDRVMGHPKIDIRFDRVVEEILGDSGMTGARVRELATNAKSDIEAAAIFPFIGLTPNTEFLGGALTLDARGAIVTDAMLRATANGVCAAGNARAYSPHRAASAAGDGAAAALALDLYLREGAWRDA